MRIQSVTRDQYLNPFDYSADPNPGPRAYSLGLITKSCNLKGVQSSHIYERSDSFTVCDNRQRRQLAKFQPAPMQTVVQQQQRWQVLRLSPHRPQRNIQCWTSCDSSTKRSRASPKFRSEPVVVVDSHRHVANGVTRV